MADEIDRANDYMQAALDAKLKTAAMKLERIDKPNPTHCVVCDEEIPDGRRQVDWYVDTCIECATTSELESNPGRIN